jgi:hypothetical protein
MHVWRGPKPQMIQETNNGCQLNIIYAKYYDPSRSLSLRNDLKVVGGSSPLPHTTAHTDEISETLHASSVYATSVAVLEESEIKSIYYKNLSESQ